MSLFGALQAACQSLKGSSPSGWGSSGTWPGWIPMKTTIVSSLPHYVHRLTGGDPPVIQEPLGWERLGRICSHRISGLTRHGGRQRREILCIRSSVRQRSASSSPPRRRSIQQAHNALKECRLSKLLSMKVHGGWSWLWLYFVSITSGRLTFGILCFSRHLLTRPET